MAPKKNTKRAAPKRNEMRVELVTLDAEGVKAGARVVYDIYKDEPWIDAEGTFFQLALLKYPDFTRVVGSMAVTTCMSSDEYFIQFVYVIPELQRKGIGRAFIENVIANGTRVGLFCGDDLAPMYRDKFNFELKLNPRPKDPDEKFLAIWRKDRSIPIEDMKIFVTDQVVLDKLRTEYLPKNSGHDTNP